MDKKIICRICMNSQNTEDLRNLSSRIEGNESATLYEIFYKVTNINIKETCFYQKICIQCCDELINCLQFITKCIESDKVLKNDEELDFNMSLTTVKQGQDENIVGCKVKVEELWEESSINKYIESTGDYFKCLSCNKYFATASGVNKHASKCFTEFTVTVSNKKQISESLNGINNFDFLGESMECESTDESVEGPDPKNKRKAEFVCVYCNKIFDRNNRLKRHLSVHNSENKPYECKICKYRFASKKNLINHELKHNEFINKSSEEISLLQINKCPHCPRKFLKKESLASHMRVHKEGFQTAKSLQRNYKCTSCEKSFFTISSLIKHILEHDDFPEYVCILCEERYSNKLELVQHLKWHENHKLFECEICKKGYNQLNKLHNHVKKVHSEEDKLLLCNVCGNSFRSSSYLKQHMRTHTGEKPVECPECPAKFTSRAGLSSHMLTHTKIKAFSCEICKTSFTKKHSLIKHNRIHTGEKPYECTTCFARFKSSYVLKRHNLTHTGEKPYPCQYCERAFAQKNDLIKHLKIHLGENIYKCNICTDSFRLHYELRDHLYEHYRKQKAAKNQS